MPKELLSIQEIKELFKIILQVRDYIKKLKQNNKLAVFINNPRLPPALTESLIIHLISKEIVLKELKNYEIEFGGNVADIIAKKNSVKKIEVKATQEQAFQYFGKKDITADYIVWVHFGNSFVDKDFSNIQVFIIRNPDKYFKEPKKITLNVVKRIVGTKLEETRFNANKI